MKVAIAQMLVDQLQEIPTKTGRQAYILDLMRMVEERVPVQSTPQEAANRIKRNAAQYRNRKAANKLDEFLQETSPSLT